jgi:hypothetical protein
MKEKKLEKSHVDAQFLALSIALLAFLALSYFVGNIVWIKDFQYFLGFISGVFALFIGVLALLRYYTDKSSFNFLFIGMGFLGVGLLDILQIVLDMGGFGSLFRVASAEIYPFTSVLSKSFLALLLFLSWFVKRSDERISNKKKRRQELLIMAGVALCFFIFLGVFVFLMLRGISVDSFTVVIVGLFALMLLVLALLGYLFNRGWLYEDFNYWIIFTLCFLILSQVFYLPFFNLEYSNMVNLSVWSRFFGYLGLLVGFLNSIYVLYQRDKETQLELEEKNKLLDETKAKVEEAYLVIQKEKWDLVRGKGTADKLLKDVVKGE